MSFESSNISRFPSPLRRLQTSGASSIDAAKLTKVGQQGLDEGLAAAGDTNQDGFSKLSEMPSPSPAEVGYCSPAEVAPFPLKEVNQAKNPEVPTTRPAEVKVFKPLEMPSMNPVKFKEFSTQETRILTPIELPNISVIEMPPMKGASVRVFTPPELPVALPKEMPRLSPQIEVPMPGLGLSAQSLNSNPATLTIDPTNYA